MADSVDRMLRCLAGLPLLVVRCTMVCFEIVAHFIIVHIHGHEFPSTGAESPAQASPPQLQAELGPCLWGALLSDGYCCDGASDCFAWGALIRGDDVARPLVARTGLECRHLCQAEPRCSGWTFVLPSHASAELRHSCWLKARAWSEDEASGAGEPGVVSGSRHCPPGHDRVLLSLRSGRTMDLSQEPGGSVVRPSWNPSGYVREAAESMRRAGWTVVRGALGAEAARALRAASERVMLELLRRDPEHAGNRGPRRYSLGSASLTHHIAGGFSLPIPEFRPKSLAAQKKGEALGYTPRGLFGRTPIEDGRPPSYIPGLGPSSWSIRKPHEAWDRGGHIPCSWCTCPSGPR
ncbi:unnamed protein product [Prorocentrum cordatum]|uniref:Apple domain-containing protein n=1 Tax=Prorocentrum cordatum TaxID=2364126 RepID=A0ABN9T9N9_9DINO|nr:unnamed protein product [Polarella glacialis]